MNTARLSKLVHDIVLDAGPILKNDPPISTLLGQSDALYTVPAVINEIRDENARTRVQTTLLPFLKIRTPNATSIRAISDFARRTGDLEVLSRCDIQVLALAYELECERNHGDWRLRSTPGQRRLNGKPPASETTQAESISPGTAGLSSPLETAAVQAEEEREPNDTDRSEPSVVQPTVEDHLADKMNAASISIAEDSIGVDSCSTLAGSKQRNTALSHLEGQDIKEEEVVSDCEDVEDGGWITPSNIKSHQAKDKSEPLQSGSETTVMQVATITTDFAMQNVLLRMNLNLLSTSLQRIQQLRTWVLRCHACFDITKDMSKQFCGRCGKPTLLRTSCSTDKDGTFQVHLKRNMQWNNRGNVYSIPKPVAGTANGKNVAGGGKGGWGHGLILAEDQKEYVQSLTNARRRKETDLMDEDFLPSLLGGDRGRAGGRPKVGAGKSVNSRRRK